MEYDVTIDREKYIGGSDIPCIMGISPFKTRYELLLEKSGLKAPDFTGNKYTAYGNALEPKIRDYINWERKTKFEPTQKIDGFLRGNLDGWDGETVLEIKTTSHIYDSLEEYKVYIVQLLFYMQLMGAKKGILAVYERNDDWSEDFHYNRLHLYDVDILNHRELLDEINAEIEKFYSDLERLANNPLLTEEDFQPTEVVAVANKVIALEKRLADLKAIEKSCKEAKQQLYDAMQKYNVKSWELYNGTKLTRVDGSEPTVETVEEFDIAGLKESYPELYQQFTRKVEKTKSGRAGYVRITLKN